MVAEMKNVMKEIDQLNDSEQKQLAVLIKQEILWQTTFDQNQTGLEKLADEAILDFKNGRIIKGDW